MIDKDTVFILGAGASCDYYFPSGPELLEDIYNYLSSPSGSKQILHLLDYSNLIENTENLLDSFRESLDSAASIDDLIASLSKRNPVYEIIGQLCITIILTKKEMEANLKPFYNNEDKRYKFPKGWYKYLWNKLYEDAKQLKDLLDNKVIFITFNYDRSLEQYLYLKALGFYRNTGKETADIISKIKVYHVYGKLGELHWPNDKNMAENKYAPLVNESDIINISKSFVHYHQEPRFSLLNIRIALEKAVDVFFLGFGFHKGNLEKLKPVSDFSDDYYNKIERVSGTALGASPIKLSEIKSDVKKTLLGVNELNKINFVDCDICEFFKSHYY